ncbi:DUF535 domain-containing protein [Erwinia psidii]|uniref:DUF535 family protein n=1 Tax=Erwinia psidii TaxID=69224 RepID=UPI00226B6120|nr:DUF535 family protein [Erwinia psidii]MCX8963063.1 DUF535 domain-containing protein [Erwinia psidii]MCX8965932.1 DUF535 domain-containing protein [Erwinia psidii]
MLVIGGMQGAHRDTPHELIRDATRACYGLFPERLLMETLLLFCRAAGMEGARLSVMKGIFSAACIIN